MSAPQVIMDYKRFVEDSHNASMDPQNILNVTLNALQTARPMDNARSVGILLVDFNKKVKPVESLSKKDACVRQMEQAISACLLALKSGDTYAAIAAAFVFGNYFREYSVICKSGMGIVEMINKFEEQQRKRRESRLGKRLLIEVDDLVLRSAYQNHKHKKDWLRCVTEAIKTKYKLTQLSRKTVRRELEIRGMMDRSG